MENNKKWDEKTTEFSKKCELICDDNFEFLNKKTRWFNNVHKFEMNSKIDYSATDQKNRTLLIELKTRNENFKIDSYDCVMIEPEKFSELCQTGTTNFQKTDVSLYINFLENTNKKFWICDIKKVMNQNLYAKENVKITYKKFGVDYDYYQKRIYINKKYGSYYEFDEKENKYNKIF